MSTEPPEATLVDVIIVGSGSAGLTAAVWLARYGLKCTILEARSGPLAVGQADGVQCRTVEIFESLGISEDLLRESYHVLEVAFWESESESPGQDRLARSHVAVDTKPGLSHQPHVILNQARLNALLLEDMYRWNKQEVSYNVSVTSVEVNEKLAQDPESLCVTVRADTDGKEHCYQAKYLLACDGAHSIVRKSLGISMLGDRSDAVWGVMDVFPKTDFPDIRRKCTIRTTTGSILLIPREGESLVRFYVELPLGTDPTSVRLNDLQDQVRRLLSPTFFINFTSTVWWSAYVIGQRRADTFTRHNRVFLTGDACHTHSPKAGQGMNVSLQDGYNIGWKLSAVLLKQCHPALLETYVSERMQVAIDLIEFDRKFAEIFSSKGRNGDASLFQNYFIKAGRYTAGLATCYASSVITCRDGSQSLVLSKNLTIGMRMPSRQIVRFCDGKVMQLNRALLADGRWRLLIFAGDIRDPVANLKLKDLAAFLEGRLTPRYISKDVGINSFIEPVLILAVERIKIGLEEIPGYFWPSSGPHQVRDLHKIYADEESYHSGHGKAYDWFGIDPQKGALIIVRPDQHISKVCDLQDFSGMTTFFDGIAFQSENKTITEPLPKM